ncbi:MAG: putative DNA binding domain-containing protein [Bacteroidota bacterium]|nr:putative DNA binding domain-containing protein [Bacteroidota bacterium]MDE2646080.1 putative DNA binding domain-containing protein [Bacteroidota bacterium]MXW33237.1 AAA family ATPase [Rhodothermaceae bacterium]MYE63347.1 AAA family ATPase [Rhodothermaceae bacterium]MYJ21196.1 AAA family ATPase [Rhodothermaceae bacterium]
MTRISPKTFWQEIALGEDTGTELKAVEFRGNKVSAPRRDSLANELAAFANGEGGRLVLGVMDDGRPQSLNREKLDLLVRFVGEICRESIKPSIRFSVFRVPVEFTDGGALLVKIPQSKTVHRSPGGYFLREGESKRILDSVQVHRLTHVREQSVDISTDTQIVSDTSIKTLHGRLWRGYLSSRIQDSPEIALTKLKFLKNDVNDDLRATVGGVLLASKNPHEWLPNAWIQAVCYRGNQLDGNQQVDSRDIFGPLDQQIREAMRFVVSNMRVAAYKNPGRIELPQFSLRAVFEAVVNAIVHRDYSVYGSRIRLFMFEDRLELYSPGGLCNSMTTDDLRTSQFTRNELLASRLGQCLVGDVPGSGGRQYFIERRGEGVSIIETDTFALTGQRPNFQLIGGRELVVVLPSARLPVPEGIPVSVEIRNHDTGKPQPNIHVLILNPNNTYSEAQTDDLGQAEFIIHARLPITVFCAARGFKAHVERSFLPDRPMEISIRSTPEGGSQIIPDGSGDLSGVSGRLGLSLDSLDRAYLYAFDIAINQGEPQPVHFALNDPIHLKDTFGVGATLWFREMIGTCCVFDYQYENP